MGCGDSRKARARGVKSHPASPGLGWETVGGVHHLRTPGGIVRARRVAVATGGYTPQGLHKSLTNKIMPILSNSMVTRPLTADERAEAGLKTTTFITDTRTLRFYYRVRSEEQTSELQSLMRISYAVFCLKKKQIRKTYDYIS